MRTRIGIHTGEPFLTEEGYVGMDVNRGARICSVAHGGQVLVSQATRELLTEDLSLRDLGLHRLKDVDAPVRLFQLGYDDFPPLSTMAVTNLPAPPTALIGRGRELSETKALLAERRLLVLVGAGGSGKTRLALELAASMVDEFEHGVWWVPLEAVTDPDLVLPSTAQALGAKDDVARHIGDKSMLLVLDSFEHVANAADHVARLLGATTRAKALVTSREPLRITGEQRYEVSPLQDDEAEALFLERSRERDRSIEPSDAIREICRRLDNLPLAIELAAARVAVLSPQQLLKRLERRLPLLTGGPRDAPERQRTLRATIAWSYRLLDGGERRLFRRLSVFAGGFALEAAEDVCEADLETLAALVDKSLVQRAEGRYSLLDTIRDYALELLVEQGEAEAARDRHANHFMAVAERADRGSPARELVGGLRADLGNFRAALAWLRSRGARELELRLAISLFDLWILGGHAAEGQARMQEALAIIPEDSGELRARALGSAGDLALDHGDFATAKELLEQALNFYRELGRNDAIAKYLTDLGHVAKCTGDYGTAEALFAESIELARDLDDSTHLRTALLNYGDFLVAAEDYARAETICRESLALCGERDSLGVGAILFSLALACLHQGRQQEASDLLQECLPIFRDADYAVGIAVSLEGLAAIATQRACPEKAARLLGKAEVLLENAGAPLEPAELALHNSTDAAIRGELGDDTLACLKADGRKMSLEHTTEYALDAIDSLGGVSHTTLQGP
jgi:predicted ATPase